MRSCPPARNGVAHGPLSFLAARRWPRVDAARTRRHRRRSLQGAVHEGMDLAPGTVPGPGRRRQRIQADGQPPSRRRVRGREDAPCVLGRRAETARRDPGAATVGGEPGQHRDLPSADREPCRRRALPRLRDAVQQRFAVLVRSRFHDTAAAEGCVGGAQLHRQARRRAALFRSADHEHARGPQARFQRAARGARRPRRVDRELRRGQVGRRERVLCAAEETANEHSAGRAGKTARRRRARDPRARDSGVREAAQVLPRRLRAERAQDPRRRSAAGRQGVLPPADPGIHDAPPR